MLSKYWAHTMLGRRWAGENERRAGDARRALERAISDKPYQARAPQSHRPPVRLRRATERHSGARDRKPQKSLSAPERAMAELVRQDRCLGLRTRPRLSRHWPPLRRATPPASTVASSEPAEVLARGDASPRLAPTSGPRNTRDVRSKRSVAKNLRGRQPSPAPLRVASSLRRTSLSPRRDSPVGMARTSIAPPPWCCSLVAVRRQALAVSIFARTLRRRRPIARSPPWRAALRLARVLVRCYTTFSTTSIPSATHSTRERTSVPVYTTSLLTLNRTFGN
ncbi:hypothetical protein PsYK624_111840 [Phanerochaete sordida]|uniref:Uncharacterized protein n=1 Tax=Phanerochaete sordida TaxID=48140 RepID=A0A9P3LGY8_9APHY|nr:hypothetical protein PsYK624_111840 [Phanerochaete sordida]